MYRANVKFKTKGKSCWYYTQKRIHCLEMESLDVFKCNADVNQLTNCFFFSNFLKWTTDVLICLFCLTFYFCWLVLYRPRLESFLYTFSTVLWMFKWPSLIHRRGNIFEKKKRGPDCGPLFFLDLSGHSPLSPPPTCVLIFLFFGLFSSFGLYIICYPFWRWEKKKE